MAPSRTPGRSKREPDYSKVGVEGRKTGVTLRDTGIRDEHGLEPIDGIFSSPEKSPFKRNGTAHESTIEEEEDMDIGQSTIPEPTEVLSARRNGKPILPPPHARSPIKTALNSSPRRSVGPTSSPARRSSSDTPSRAMSHPLLGRKLDFSTGEPSQSIEHSPRKARSSASPSPAVKSGKLKRKAVQGKERVFDLSLEEDEEEGELEQSEEITADTLGAGRGEDFEEDGVFYDASAPPMDDDELLHINGNEISEVEDETQEASDLVPRNTKAQPKGKRGRKPKAGASKLQEVEPSVIEDDPIPPPKAMKRAGRPKKTVNVEEEQPHATDEQPQHAKGKPGRKAKQEVFRDIEEEVEMGSPRGSKRQRLESVEATPVEAKKKGPKPKTRPPPSERDPNAKIVAAKRRDKAPSAESAKKFARPRSRGLTISRSGTPAEDDGARVLKSGRTSVKPIAFWRNERIVYGDSNLDGKDLILPGIEEIIRTEEIIVPRPKQAYRRHGSKSNTRPLAEVEEEDEDQEEWEIDPGYLRSEVMQWDPELERGIDEDPEEIEVALAPLCLERLFREVKGSEFKYAKTVTLPFFHSGMVDLPPGGEKKTKNSRKNHMVFMVFSGRVQVKVADTTFSIGRGGMWQVPRGNLYSIANVHTRASRIFFAQGCFMTPEDVEEETIPPGTE